LNKVVSMKTNRTIQYKNYHGSVEVSLEENIVHGKILFIDDLVSYQSDTPNGIYNAFKEAVDDYIETCKSVGKEPQKSFNGSFNIRIGCEQHKLAVIKANELGMTLNELIKNCINNFLAGSSNQTVTHLHIHKDSTKEPGYLELENDQGTWASTKENGWKITSLQKH